MTNEEFRKGWEAGKRTVLIIPKRGKHWASNGKMDHLCNTVQTVEDIFLDYGDDGVLISIDGWILSEDDFVKFVDGEEEEDTILSIIFNSMQNDDSQLTLEDATRMAKNLLKAGYILNSDRDEEVNKND